MIRRLWHRHTFTRWTDPISGKRSQVCPCGKRLPWFDSGSGPVPMAHEQMKAKREPAKVEPIRRTK